MGRISVMDARNKKVTIFFNNGLSYSGVVVSWEDNSITVMGESGDTLVVYNLKANVMMIKVSAQQAAKVEAYPNVNSNMNHLINEAACLPPILEPEFPPIKVKGKSNRLLKAIELHGKRVKSIRQNIFDTFKGEKLINEQKTNYDTPNFQK